MLNFVVTNKIWQGQIRLHWMIQRQEPKWLLQISLMSFFFLQSRSCHCEMHRALAHLPEKSGAAHKKNLISRDDALQDLWPLETTLEIPRETASAVCSDTLPVSGWEKDESRASSTFHQLLQLFHPCLWGVWPDRWMPYHVITWVGHYYITWCSSGEHVLFKLCLFWVRNRKLRNILRMSRNLTPLLFHDLSTFDVCITWLSGITWRHVRRVKELSMQTVDGNALPAVSGGKGIFFPGLKQRGTVSSPFLGL